MDNGTDIKQLVQMSIGQINQLTKAQMKIQDVIDRQKETVASFIEQEKINEDWAEKFIEDKK